MGVYHPMVGCGNREKRGDAGNYSPDAALVNDRIALPLDLRALRLACTISARLLGRERWMSKGLSPACSRDGAAVVGAVVVQRLSSM